MNEGERENSEVRVTTNETRRKERGSRRGHEGGRGMN